MTTAIEPSADEIERVTAVITEKVPSLTAWIARIVARAAILAMDRRAEVVGPIIPNSGKEWELELRACGGANDQMLPKYARRLIADLWAEVVAREPETLAALASPPAPAVAVQEGWKLVPVEPTEGMIEAGCRALHNLQGTGDADAPLHSPYQNSWEEPDSTRWQQWRHTVSNDDFDGEIGVFTAMLAAAPEPPATRPEAEIRNDGIEMAAKWLEDKVVWSERRGSISRAEDCREYATAIRALKEPGDEH